MSKETLRGKRQNNRYLGSAKEEEEQQQRRHQGKKPHHKMYKKPHKIPKVNESINKLTSKLFVENQKGIKMQFAAASERISNRQ